MTSKVTDAAGQSNSECCMCGDCGFSDELFQCKLCQVRSQHSYCSNIYPKAASYGTCNWCLIQKEDIKEKSLNSSNSSSSCKNNGSADDESMNKKIKNCNSAQNIGCKNGVRGSNLQLHPNKPIKKRKSPEIRSPPTSPSVVVSTSKRIVTNGALEERLRKAKSENISSRSGITKQVFRNKVRRYKLLDEVST